MAKYDVSIATADINNAGTYDYIILSLIGSNAQMWYHVVESWDFAEGDVATFSLFSEYHLGTLLHAYVDKFPFIIPNDWHCLDVSVDQPDEEVTKFPAYRWHEGQTMILRTGHALLQHQEVSEGLMMSRTYEIQENKLKYQWKSCLLDGPLGIAASSFYDLPRDVRCTDPTAINMDDLSQIQLELRLLIIDDVDDPGWSNFDDIRRFIKPSLTPACEYLLDHWQEDEVFGSHFLCGSFARMIQKCTVLPSHISVTHTMVEPSLCRSMSFEQEMEAGNVYMVDCSLLDGIPANSVDPEMVHYVGSPTCLLYLTPEEQLKPIAIQLWKYPGENDSISLPSDSQADWLFAKMWVKSAALQLHLLEQLFLRVHLVSEAFTVATLRCLPSVHPVYKILIPHLKYTLGINIEMREKLLGATGYFSNFLATGGPSAFKVIAKAHKLLTYKSLMLPTDIITRDVATLPGYHYRDDALKIWRAISGYVSDIIDLYYKSNVDLWNDVEVQTWIREIVDALQLPETSGFPFAFDKLDTLKEFVTMVIFTCTAQYSALNSSMVDWHACIPNCPTTMHCPPPQEKGNINLEYILSALPNMNQCSKFLAIQAKLSSRPVQTALGQHSEMYFTEPGPQAALQRFRTSLQTASADIAERNADLALPYCYLIPENIHNGILA
uniref:polyunsaturated fatty acid 5-lipoxygenase-like n=1 Tax=Myxine glutinosa TaxID=7769 RepID=UPI00358DEE1D